MIIIWRRWGILMPIICILATLLAEHLFHPRGRAQSVDLFRSAVLVSLTGLFLDKKQQTNDFFFLPMKYWGLVLATFGIVILVHARISEPSGPRMRHDKFTTATF
jgi:hypothetical protein